MDENDTYDEDESPCAYDQSLSLVVNAFSTTEALQRVMDVSGNLDFSRLFKEEADFEETVSITPSDYQAQPGAQAVEVVLTRRAYMGNGTTVSDAEYFFSHIQGGLPLDDAPDLPDTPAMVSYRSALARQEQLETALPPASSPHAEQDLACGQWLTQEHHLQWSGPHGVWAWDRRSSPLHCKTLVSMCERPSKDEAMQRLGEIARYMMDDPDLPHLIDRQCVPVLQAGWQQANIAWRERELNASLPPPSVTSRKPRF